MKVELNYKEQTIIEQALVQYIDYLRDGNNEEQQVGIVASELYDKLHAAFNASKVILTKGE